MRISVKLAIAGLAAVASLISVPALASASVVHGPYIGHPIRPDSFPVLNPCFSTFAQQGYDGFQVAADGWAITTQQESRFEILVTTVRGIKGAGCGQTWFPSSDTANNGKNALVTDMFGDPVSPELSIQDIGGHLSVGTENEHSPAQDLVAHQILSGPFTGQFTWTVGPNGPRLEASAFGAALVPNAGPANSSTAFTFTLGS